MPMAHMGMTSKLPDGLSEAHALGRAGLRRLSNPLSILVLGGMVFAACLGLFGGQESETFEGASSAVRLRVETPKIIRSGEFFEMRITIEPLVAIPKLALAVSSGFWRDTTVNDMIPQATAESYIDGFYHFDYGKRAPGESFTIKVDCQINSPYFGPLAGELAILDDETELISIFIKRAVQP